VADLRERAAFFEEALQTEPVQRLLVGLDADRYEAIGESDRYTLRFRKR
jgi:hypothetical protein